MTSELDAWFVREILVHEGALVSWLARCWPNREEVHDLRQETYVRVYQAASRSRPLQPKAFLFAAARNLMADHARRSRVVSIEPMGDLEPSYVLTDEVSPERWCGGRQVLARLAEAFDRLPDRCRDVLWLRRVEELSQKEVAMRLGISEKTVEKHVAKGMRLVADYFHGGSGEAAADSARPAVTRAGGARGHRNTD